MIPEEHFQHGKKLIEEAVQYLITWGGIPLKTPFAFFLQSPEGVLYEAYGMSKEELTNAKLKVIQEL